MMISFGDYPAHITLKDHFLIFPFGKKFGLFKILRVQKNPNSSFPEIRTFIIALVTVVNLGLGYFVKMHTFTSTLFFQNASF